MNNQGEKLHIPRKPEHKPEPEHQPEHRFVSEAPQSVHTTLSIEEMEYILQNCNGTNLRKKLSRSVVNAYRRSMAAGSFGKGSTISFDSAGNLIDGQHRLIAAARGEEKFPFECGVHYGLDAREANKMDTQSKRSLAMRLGTGALEAAVASYLAHLEAQKGGKVPRSAITIDEKRSALESNREVINYIAEIAPPKFRRAGLCAAVATGMKEMPKMAKSLFKEAREGGEGLKPGSPAYKLRQLVETPAGGGGQLKDDYEQTIALLDEYRKSALLLKRAASARSRAKRKSKKTA